MIQWQAPRATAKISRAPGRERGGEAVATLTALTFHSLTGADQALVIVEQLQRDGALHVLDAATIRWPRRSRKPDPHVQARTGQAQLDASFWRLLTGIIFLAPRFEATGGGSGAVTGSLADIGIDEIFIRDVRTHAVPNTSALFLLTNGAVTDRGIEALDGLNPSVIATNLPASKESRLFEIFAVRTAPQRSPAD